MRFSVLLVLVPLLVTPAIAQEPPVFELPEVIVPGRRPQPATATPASVTVLTQEDLRRLGVVTVGEALNYVEQVYVRVQGGVGTLSLPTVRGSSPNQVLVLIDGVPVNSVMQSLVDLSTLSAAGVDRVEILRGPFSAIYGGPALGGVISITTLGAARSEVSFRSGGLGTTALTGRWADPSGHVVLAADRFASEGFRVNSDVASTTILGRGAWETAAGDGVIVNANVFTGALGVPGPTAFPSVDARQQEQRTILSARWQRPASDGAWSAFGYWSRDDFRFVDPDPTFPVDDQVATRVAGANVQRVVRPSADRLYVIGAEGQSQVLAHTGSVGNRQAAVGALYVQNDRQLGPRMLVSAGVRYDVHSLYGGQINPRLGIVYAARETLTLRAGVGRTFRGPTFSELYFTPFDNPALRPESAWATDAGLAWRPRPDLEVRAGVFATLGTDLIRPDASFVPQNIGRATITGGSLAVAGRFVSGVSGTAAVTALRAEDGATGRQLLRVPWVTAFAALHQEAFGGVLSLLVSYVGPRPDVDPATFTAVLMPGYTISNLRFSLGSADSGQWQIAVDNLTDARYEPIAGFPAPGRTAYIAFVRRY